MFQQSHQQPNQRPEHVLKVITISATAKNSTNDNTISSADMATDQPEPSPAASINRNG
jgi:hypothetical protein